MLNYRGEHGFSLMELLIVMTIMGLLMSIVAPLSLSAISKSEARVELQETKNWLRLLRNKAFISNENYTVTLNGNKARLFVGKELQEEKVLVYISFPLLQVNVNKYGIVEPSIIPMLFLDKQHQLDMRAGK